MGKPRSDELEQAVIDAVKNDQTLQGYLKDRVHTLSERVFDPKQQKFIVQTPLVAVFYAGGSYEPRVSAETRYRHTASVILVAVAENLRGPAEAKRGFGSKPGALDIIEDLKTLFAFDSTTQRARELALPGNTTGLKPHCRLVSDQPELQRAGQVAWSLEIQVIGHWDGSG